MTEIIQSVDRPDVNGTLPKMQTIADLAKIELENDAPYLKIVCNDNLMSHVTIYGSFDDPLTWVNSIYENSKYFRFTLTPAKGQRYYTPGAPVTVELEQRSYKLDHVMPSFRARTGNYNKVILAIGQWLDAYEEQ